MIPRILVVDDHVERGPAVTNALSFRYACRLVPGFDDALQALSRADEPWDAVVSDFDLGGQGTGMQVLELARTLSERTWRVFYTSYFVGAVAQEALRRTHAHAVLDARAVDFISRLRETVERLVESEDDEFAMNGSSDDAAQDPANPLTEEWCAHAARTREFLARLREAAAPGGPVYAVGEEGSGKHLARRTFRVWATGARRGAATDGAVTFVSVPPLRDRRADIVPLAERMLVRLAVARPPAKRLSAEVTALLPECDWKDNVRGLHAALLAAWQKAGDRVEIGWREFGEPSEAERNPLHAGGVEGELERVVLLLRAERTVNAAARRAGQTPQNFRRTMGRLGVLRLDSDSGAED